jgi:hypothetical protein
MSRIGTYEAQQHAERVASLAAATTRLYGVPADAVFGYLLVGIAPRERAGEAASDMEPATVEAGANVSAPDGAAIPLGAKLSTVAVLELLGKAPLAQRRRAAASSREWAPHPY